MIITSPQKPSRSFYPRGFCFVLVRGGFLTRGRALGAPVVERAQRVETARPDADSLASSAAWAGLEPVGVKNEALRALTSEHCIHP